MNISSFHPFKRTYLEPTGRRNTLIEKIVHVNIKPEVLAGAEDIIIILSPAEGSFETTSMFAY